MANSAAYDPQTLARGAEALLREHPDALVAGLASNGLIVPVPQSISLYGQQLIEGRAVIDDLVAADRNKVLRMWVDLREQGSTSAQVRMLRAPSQWVTLRFIDLQEIHGVVLAVILPSDQEGEEGEDPAIQQAPAAPRFCTLTEDEGARVIDCDPAFTAMFGFELEEMFEKSVLDQIHPDDQGRAVEGWLSVLSTGRNQQTRLRRRRKDGSWMWVDTTLHNCLNEPGRNHVLVEIIDISAEMQAQEALADREELLRRLTNAMPVGLLHLNTSSEVLYSNDRLLDILHGDDAAAQATDEDEAEAGPQPRRAAEELLSTLTEDGLASFRDLLEEVLGEGVDADVELDVQLRSGEERRALMNLRALLRQSGEVSGAIICVLDVTDSARARRELEKRATFDPLTGCYNRSAILSELELELTREASSGIGAVYVDLDQFKPVNDSFGHAAGDEVLVQVADRLRTASRDSDLIGRLGGDEFLIVLRDVPSEEVAMTVAERICGALEDTFQLPSDTVSLKGSVGVAFTTAAASDGEELVRRADSAMYRSKDNGQGRPVLAGAESEQTPPPARAERRRAA